MYKALGSDNFTSQSINIQFFFYYISLFYYHFVLVTKTNEYLDNVGLLYSVLILFRKN